MENGGPICPPPAERQKLLVGMRRRLIPTGVYYDHMDQSQPVGLCVYCETQHEPF